MKLQITKNWFEIYSEKALLTAGTIFFVLGSLLGYAFNARYDGVFDVHFSLNIPLYRPFLDNLINTVCLFVALFVAAKAVNKNTRPVDIIATVLMARIVFYLIPFFNINDYMTNMTSALLSSLMETGATGGLDLSVTSLLVFLVFAAVSVVLLVLFIILAYRGFKTASNSKTAGHKVYFALALIGAEILSKVVLLYV